MRYVPLHLRFLLIAALASVTVGSAANSVVAASPDDSAALRSLYAGNGFLNRELYELAADEYRSFLAEHGDHAEAPVARYGLAVSLFHLKQYDEAIREITPLRGRPDFEYAATSETILGQCHLLQGRYAEAAEVFGAVLETYPDHDLADDAAALQAESFYYAGAYERVEAPCAQLERRWPDSPLRERADFFAGLARMARDDPAGAADRFAALLDRSPAGAYAQQTALLLAQCRHRAGSIEEARRGYERVLESAQSPYAADALYGLALALFQLDSIEPAGRRLDEMLERFPEHELRPRATFLLARVEFERGDFDDASTLFAAAAAVPSEDQDDAAYWIGKCALRQGEPKEAAARFAAAASAHPASPLLPEMIYDRAVAQMRYDDLAGAMATLGEFESKFPSHALAADAGYLAATALHRDGAYDASAETCRQFIVRYADHELASAVAFLEAENEFLRGDHAAAARGFGDYLRDRPDAAQRADARYRLAMAHYHLGRYDEAGPALEEITQDADSGDAFPLAWYALGDLRFQAEAWADAERALRRYLGTGDAGAADDAWLKVGLAELRQDDPESAIVAFDELLDRSADSPHAIQALFERGQALVILGRSVEAADVFAAVLEDGEASSRFAPYALNHLGAIAHERGDYDVAADFFARAAAAASSPEFAGSGGSLAAEATFGRGRALMAAERHADAADAFARVMAAYPNWSTTPEAAALHAVAQSRQGIHAAALDAIERVEREHLPSLDASIVDMLLYEKAWCQRELNSPDAAESTYVALLERGGTSDLKLHAMLELAELEANDERFEAASRRLERLEAMLAASPDALPADRREDAAYRRGVCEFRLERYDAAARILGELLDANPETPLAASAGLLCGEARLKQGEHQRAARRLARVVAEHRGDQNYGPSLLRLGECQAVLADWPGSAKSYETYLAAFPDHEQWYRARFGVGWAREHEGRFEEAIAAYGEVAARHQGPTAARAQFQIGECLFEQQRYDDALRELIKVDILYGYPEWSAAALYEAGRCFEKLSDPVQARKHFERVRAEHASTEWSRLAAERLDELSRTSLPGHSSGGGRDGRNGRGVRGGASR